MEIMEQAMEYETESLENFLNLTGYESSIFEKNLLKNFEKILKNFSFPETSVEIDKEIKKIQLLILNTTVNDNYRSEIIKFLTLKIKQFFNNYLLAYIILRKLREEISVSIKYGSTKIDYTCGDNILDNKSEINTVKEMIYKGEAEFEKITKLIAYMAENGMEE